MTGLTSLASTIKKSKFLHIAYKSLVVLVPTSRFSLFLQHYFCSQSKLLPQSTCRLLRYHLLFLLYTSDILFLSCPAYPHHLSLPSPAGLTSFRRGSLTSHDWFSAVSLWSHALWAPLWTLLFFLTIACFFGGKLISWMVPLVLQASGGRMHGRKK